MPRKLCVALWHIMMGHVIGTLERLDTPQTKLSKFATEIGPPAALTARRYYNKEDFAQKKTLCVTQLTLDLTTCLHRLVRWRQFLSPPTGNTRPQTKGNLQGPGR